MRTKYSGFTVSKKKRKETRLRTVRRCQTVLAKLSLALEKALKSVLRDAKSHVSPQKLEKFRLDRYRAVDRYRGVDCNSESKLEPLTAV